MYEDINVGCVSKDDFLVLCKNYITERMKYEKTGDEVAFVKYCTIVECIYTLGLDYEFRQFCNQDERMKELK